MKNLWYAIMMDNDDTDWGYGTFERSQAVARVKELQEDGCPDAYIAVIDGGVCVEEIRNLD